MQMHDQPRCKSNAIAMHPYLTLYKTSTVVRWIMGISRSRSRLRRTAPAPQPQQKKINMILKKALSLPDLHLYHPGNNPLQDLDAPLINPHERQNGGDRGRGEGAKCMRPALRDCRPGALDVRSPNQRWILLQGRGLAAARLGLAGWVRGKRGINREEKYPFFSFKKNRPPHPPKLPRGGASVSQPLTFSHQKTMIGTV